VLFEAAVIGAYYGKLMAAAEADKPPNYRSAV
jgi:hypothetical protein